MHAGICVVECCSQYGRNAEGLHTRIAHEVPNAAGTQERVFPILPPRTGLKRSANFTAFFGYPFVSGIADLRSAWMLSTTC